MEEESQHEARIDFVATVCFVPRGVAKQKPDKIELTEEELANVIQNSEAELNCSDYENDSTESDVIDENDDIDDETDDTGNEYEDSIDDSTVPNDGANNENNSPMDTEDNANSNIYDEYSFQNYDNENIGQTASLHSIVQSDYLVHDEDDSEAEDDIIKPTDNLLLVGHVQEDAASLEIWVLNEDDECLYTFNDFVLPHFPLCIEWLSHDPTSETPGNMCAIGGIHPVISIWDLDIQNSLEPAFKLGTVRGPKARRYGHKKAVLDLSWNRNYPHILASGSVDKTLLLWDLDEGLPHTTVKMFTDKVQSIEFHPNDAQMILSGCADYNVRLIDCRTVGENQTAVANWKANNEVEKVLWNPNDENCFVVGDTSGALYYADKRQNDKWLWTYANAHDEEISGVCFNKEIPNMLNSTSTKGELKIWDFNNTELKQVWEHDFKIGRIQCLTQCPDDPFTLAFGGEKFPWCSVYNIKNFEAVRKTFNIPDLLKD